MTLSSSAAFPSFLRTEALAKPRLSLFEWIGTRRSAVAMADAVPATGRAINKQLARICAMSEAM